MGNEQGPQQASEVQTQLRGLFDAQKSAFRQSAPRSYRQRIEALDLLLDGMHKYEDRLVDALIADYGNRARIETRLLEIFPVVDEIRHSKSHLRSWMRSRSAGANWQFWPSSAQVMYQPLGVVGIVGAWNYQILLTLSPLVNVLAAGNHAMIKPSELAPQTADTIAQLIKEQFGADYVTVVNGGVDVSTAFTALPFDHLIFTGSGRVGKLVMRAASENLTPVTLELGGKSPALVHESYSTALAADRICSGKFWNCGQTCVAPDYALVPKAQLDDFVEGAKASLSRRYPTLIGNPDYTHVINAQTFNRMEALVADAVARGGTAVTVNPANEDCNADNQVFPPTIVYNVRDDMKIMQEEIFGPILPVATYETLEGALDFINDRDRPLALYYFDHSRKRIKQVMEGTTSGGVTINDTIFHQPQNNLPFGGVGPSGMGAYHGIDGFATFSKKKGIFMQSRLVGWVLSWAVKPPYTKFADWLIGFLIRNPHR